jgi:hypothetical protein
MARQLPGVALHQQQGRPLARLGVMQAAAIGTGTGQTHRLLWLGETLSTSGKTLIGWNDCQ